MITIEEINSLLANEKYKPKKSEQWEKVRRTMFVHTRGAKPSYILTERRPNEDPEVKKYREMIYEPITKGSMNRAIDKLYRIFQNANFSIQVSDELDQYLNETKFNDQYFYSYIQKYVMPRMIEDPNAWLVWLPYGEGITDSGIKVEVYPELIESDDIKYINEDVITWEAEEEKSYITKNGKQVEEGEVYYTLTSEGYYKHIQYGDSRKKQFELIPIYMHEIGELPACVLGGDQTAEDYYESYFSAFVPFANEAIRQYSDWQGVMTTSAFPYREEVAETCDARGCRDGIIFDSESEEHSTCHKCKGTGRVVSRSPYGVFIREKGNSAFGGGEASSNEPLIRFISPPVDIIQYSGEAWQTLLKKAEEALHLNTIDEAQSGVAKTIDREDSFAQLTKISNNIFDEIIYKSLLYIEAYRNVSNPQAPIIVKPISFSMKTEDDLLEEVSRLTDKNAPIAFLVETTKDLARKRFSGNKSVSRIVEVLVSYDPIYHLSSKDKAMLLASGTIKKEDLLKSLYAYKVLTSLVAQNGTEFLEQNLTEIFAALDQALQPIVETYIPKEVVDIAGVQVGDVAQAATDVNQDIAIKEAEAKANLKGSVGGVQGIIQIQQSVAAGTTTQDAGIALLVEIYGFDEATSRRIIGQPKAVEPTAQAPIA